MSNGPSPIRERAEQWPKCRSCVVLFSQYGGDMVEGGLDVRIELGRVDDLPPHTGVEKPHGVHEEAKPCGAVFTIDGFRMREHPGVHLIDLYGHLLQARGSLGLQQGLRRLHFLQHG